MVKSNTSAATPSTSAPNECIRLFLFESTQVSCELLSYALEKSQFGLTVVGSGVTLAIKDEFKLAESDVAVISSTLADGPLAGFTLLRKIMKKNSSVRCVMLFDYPDRDLVVEAFRSGAVGVCERGQSYEMLCKCVYSVHRGQVWANSQQLRYVLEALATGIHGRVTDVRGQLLLTRREDEICSLVAAGLKSREIAVLLKISEHTVKNHVFHIFEKLGISSRAELVLYLLGQNRAHAREPTTNDVVDGGEPLLERIGVGSYRPKRMPQAHGHTPPGHAAGGIGLRNGLESFARLLVPERVELGNSTLKLRSHSGGTGGRELNCAKLSHVTEM